MKRNWLISLWLILFCTISVKGQNLYPKPDSLESYKAALTLPEPILSQIADSLYHTNQWENALFYYEVLANRCETSPNPSYEYVYASGFGNSGNIYYQKGLYSQAMESYLKGLRIIDRMESISISEKHNKQLKENDSLIQDLQAELYKNIGNIYCSFGDFTLGSNYYKQALALAEKTDNIALRNKIRYNLAGAFCFLNEIDSAKRYYEQSIQEREETSLYHYSVLMNLGLIQECEGDIDAAIKTYKDLVAYMDTCQLEARHKGSVLSGLSRLNEIQGNLDAALHYSKENEKIASKAQQFDMLVSTYKDLSRIYKQKNDIQKAMDYKLRFIDLSDSVFNQRNFNNLKNAQFLSEMNRTKATIQQLNEETRQKAAQIEIQQRWLLTITIIAIIFIVLLIVIYRQKQTLAVAYRNLFNRSQEQLQSEGFYKKRIAALESELKKEWDFASRISSSKKKNADMAPPIPYSYPYPVQREKLLSDIQHIMDDTLEFCNSDFSVEKLATLVNSNSRYVSQTINEEYNKNFRSFLNEYRIKEAMRRLSDMDSYGHFTIQAIAESVGYKSQANFIAVFTKHTGIKPSMYQKLSKQKDRQVS